MTKHLMTGAKEKQGRNHGAETDGCPSALTGWIARQNEVEIDLYNYLIHSLNSNEIKILR